DASLDIFNRLDLEKHRDYNEFNLIQGEFESRLGYRWYSGFVSLHAIIRFAEEATMNEIDVFMPKNNSDEMKKIMNVLFKLCAKSVQTSKEIFTLLRSGYPDGAIARWRSLHENSVVFKILIKNFEDIDFTYELINRYMDFSDIEVSKEINIYKIATPKIGLDPIEESIEEEFRRRKRELITKYGRDFLKPNMWAKPVFSEDIRDIKFFHLEQIAEVDNLNPYYNLANYQVHTSPKGLFNSNGFIPGESQKNFYNFGSSNYGLSLPGQLTAISLGSIIISLLSLNVNLDTLIRQQAIEKLLEPIQDEFYSIESQIEAEENERED
ncbi:DUF5677 domain-containing protein, partial [Streptomyces sp. NPDC057131]|uniref:DUF5677 domain-containing protein n=1 Tax=Streptomyces sp. NPDC057131 TaxID=3346027 RepID=UPI00363F372C